MTFEQLEALFWIAQPGGFAQAAHKLSTSQLAVSKRIRELEDFFDTPLFDRSQRTARLTEKGEEMFVLARKLLGQRDAAIEQFGRPEVLERRLRLGVTELTAMTWLPRLVETIRRLHPRVVIEPTVDASPPLRERMLADEPDLIVVTDSFAGMLQAVEVAPPLPPVPYVAVHRGERRSSLVAAVAMLAQECCDFGAMFQSLGEFLAPAAGAPQRA